MLSLLLFPVLLFPSAVLAQTNPDTLEQSKPAAIEYPANILKPVTQLKTKEFFRSQIEPSATEVEDGLTIYAQRTLFQKYTLEYVSPNRLVYEVAAFFSHEISTDGGKCLKDATANYLFDAETGKLLNHEVRCRLENFKYKYPLLNVAPNKQFQQTVRFKAYVPLD